jgi:hypothetical protein
MSPVWVAFACGLFLGGMGGVFTIALCMAAKNGDPSPHCYCDDAEQGRACRSCEEPSQVGGASHA